MEDKFKCKKLKFDVRAISTENVPIDCNVKCKLLKGKFKNNI